MADWGPVLVAAVPFVSLLPGQLFQLPGRAKVIECSNMHTSGMSIFIHAIILFLLNIFLVVIDIHIYAT